MRRHCCLLVAAALFSLAILGGCGNPIKRPPANVFPGSQQYEKRVSDLKLSPAQAYEIAHEQAEEEGRLHMLSRKPTVIVKRTYVFSMPQPSGASLQGYHVNGDNGKVKYVNEKKTVSQ